MSYIKFNGDKSKTHYNGIITQIDDNTVMVSGCPQKLNGFGIYTDTDLLFGDYSDYIYDYGEPNLGEDIFKYTNDGHKWVKKKHKVTFSSSVEGGIEGELVQYADDFSEIAVPTVLTVDHYKFNGWSSEIPTSGEITSDMYYTAMFEYVPTHEELLAEARENKTIELNEAQQLVIVNGVDVTFPSGNTERFTLTEHDQTSLLGLMVQVKEGLEYIPWHTNDHSEHCKYYSNSDMQIICNMATLFVTYHVTYFRDLRIYVNDILTDVDMINSISYGDDMPEEYKSDVLKDLERQMTELATSMA